MSLTDPAHYQAAQHIQTALFTPDLTSPPGTNKLIPGLEATGLFLTRTIDSRINASNRRRAVGAYRKYDYDYKHLRRDLGLECDEFPFASTLQGAASGGDFSVKSMPSSQNQAGGRALNAWYNTFRILDGDQFYLNVRQ